MSTSASGASTERLRLEDVLESITPDQQQAFKHRIQYPERDGVPSFFRSWINNIFAETRLTRRTWTTLVSGILALPEGSDPATIFAFSVGLFREELSLSKPSGPEAEIPRRRCLGRVVPRLFFERYLRDRVFRRLSSTTTRSPTDPDGMGGSRRTANDFVSSLLESDFFDIPEALSTLCLHDFIMWATFSEEDDPFYGIYPDRKHLRCVLGLIGKNTELLKLVYNLPRTHTAHIPTVIEAYAGGSWEVLFQPALPGSKYGRTIPRCDCGNEKTQAEVVHLPVTLSDLCARIEAI